MRIDPMQMSERLRAARHEGGHWLAYKAYGLTTGGITVPDENSNRFYAEVFAPEPPHGDDYLFRRMKTVTAGFAAERIKRKAGELGFEPPTVFKPYVHLKGDLERFASLFAGLSTRPLLTEHELFARFADEVGQLLSPHAAALDAIQDLVSNSPASTISGEQLETHSDVTEAIGVLRGFDAGLIVSAHAIDDDYKPTDAA